jgi:hypothetical protein
MQQQSDAIPMVELTDEELDTVAAGCHGSNCNPKPEPSPGGGGGNPGWPS